MKNTSPPVELGFYVTWDVETTIRTSFKRKGNPFDPDNYVVQSGYAYGDEAPQDDYFGRRSAVAGEDKRSRYERPTGDELLRDPDWFIKLIEPPAPYTRPKWLVGMNIKFDLLYALRCPRNLEAWMRYVAAGGNVWDIQLAEYLIKGMGKAEHMLSMDEIAPRYGGNVKHNPVGELWDAGVCTTDIDRQILTDYLIGHYEETRGVDREGKEQVIRQWQHGDIGNTRLSFLGQFAIAKQAGQLRSIELNMGALMATVEMERNGMHVDKQLGLEQAKKLADDLAKLTVELVGYLPKDLPFTFNWGSGAQKSALIFGGDVKYKKWLPHLTEDGQMQYAKKKVDAYQLMLDGSWVSSEDYDPECHGPVAQYGSGKRMGEVKTKKIDVDNKEKPKGAIQDVIYTFPRITEPSPRWATAVEGRYSVSGEVIEALANRDIPFLKALTSVEKLSKDLGTYYISYNADGTEDKGMLTLVQWDEIIHHMLNMVQTVTARLSSSSPNLQNLPKGGKSLVKTLFKSRWCGGFIIQSDFTALEVYVQAILTRCAQLIADLLGGLDMHCVRVSQTYDISYEEALLRCKGDKSKGIDPIPEWDKKRTEAKVFSFQRAYGAGIALIAESTGIPEDIVRQLAEAEEARYPEVGRYYNALTQKIEDNAVSSGTVIDHPDVPGLKCHLETSHFVTPDGKRYSWRSTPSPKFLAERPASKGGKATSFSPTEIKNYPVQGTGGEWAKAAMWISLRVFYAAKNLDGYALLVNQVHDAIYVDAAPGREKMASAMLHACMLEASVFMEWRFAWEVPCPVPSETMYGANMMEENPCYKMDGWTELTEKMRPRVRQLIGYQDYIPSIERKAA